MQSFGIVVLLFAITAGIVELLPMEHRPKAGVGFLLSIPVVMTWRYYAAKRHYRKKANNG